MIVKEFFFFDMDELSRPFDHVKQAKERPPKTKRRKTGSSVFARRPPAPTEQKDLIRFEPSLRSERKALGPSIRQARKPASQMIDGDGDGKCQEEGGKWVPCPPGVRVGTRLARVAGRNIADVGKGGGIDRIDEIHPAYRQAMKRRMEKLNLTRRHLMDQARRALSEADEDLVEEAKQWYGRLHMKTREMVEAINTKHKSSIGFEQGAGIIAALSPAREFGKNVRDARKLMLVHAENAPFEITDELKESYRGQKDRLDALLARVGNMPKPSDFKDDELDLLVGLHPTLATLGNSTGLINVIRAYSILRGKDIEDAISGPKMRSFYSNIVNPDGLDRVTIDTWMYRAMVSARKKFAIGPDVLNLQGHEAAGRKVQDIFQGTPKGIKGTDIPDNIGLYPIFAEVIRDLAREYGLTPSALQAIIWEVQRVRDGYAPTQWEKIAKEFLV